MVEGKGKGGAPGLLTPIVQTCSYTSITARQELGNEALAGLGSTESPFSYSVHVRTGQAAHPPGQAQGADTEIVAAANESKYAQSDDDRCYHPPNRSAERAFALAASSSLSLGGAAVSSEASSRSVILAMSSTAE
jgi:hypothetical protein